MKQRTNTYRNHFSRSYENCSIKSEKSTLYICWALVLLKHEAVKTLNQKLVIDCLFSENLFVQESRFNTKTSTKSLGVRFKTGLRLSAFICCS